MEFIMEQLHAFLITLLSGIIMGVLVDFYRIIRGIMKPGRFVTALGDLFFPIVCGTILYTFLLFNNYGEIRMYVLLGAGIGFYGYRRTLSPLVVRGSLFLR